MCAFWRCCFPHNKLTWNMYKILRLIYILTTQTSMRQSTRKTVFNFPFNRNITKSRRTCTIPVLRNTLLSQEPSLWVGNRINFLLFDWSQCIFRAIVNFKFTWVNLVWLISMYQYVDNSFQSLKKNEKKLTYNRAFECWTLTQYMHLNNFFFQASKYWIFFTILILFGPFWCLCLSF